jgi:CrcB protein
MTAWHWVALVAAGGVGAVLRFWIDGTLERRVATAFPVGTFVINVAGSFALGVVVGTHAGGAVAFVVGTGLIGSFTTFSTWMFESQRLSEDGELRLAAWNLCLSIAAGVTAAGAGWALGAAV